ncbi:MAG: hypothetical protein QOF62_1222 [Pyrinomonadaceae bacterium]|jgi:hypothetical protein|nr:hypothetical protein [Pyrinomonadaceae bacterium]
MTKKLILGCASLAAIVGLGAFFGLAGKEPMPDSVESAESAAQSDVAVRNFDLEILVGGRPLEEYYARNKKYVEAIPGAEYEVTVRNPFPFRVAVALSVDGLNTIDARRTSAWNASKWVIEPYGTISINGWQMSSERARRFYFTSEQDSYGAKLGQTSNLGVVSAVFFRELRPIPVPVTPAPPPEPRYEERSERERSSTGADSSAGTSQAPSARANQGIMSRDDDYAATGIGRSVHNDVQWVNMNLDARAVGEVTIRYEYYATLVRLGIIPRHYPSPDPLRRRESASGFEDRRFSPEP